MCNDVKILNSVETLNSGVKIGLAESEKSVVANKKGTLSCYSNKGILLVVNNILFVPKLRYNLLSVRKLASYGIVTTFKENHAVLKKNGRVIATASLKGDLYEVEVSAEIQNEVDSLNAHEASGGERQVVLHDPNIVKQPIKNEMSNRRKFVALPSQPDRNKSDWKVISSNRVEGRSTFGKYPKYIEDNDRHTAEKLSVQNRLILYGKERDKVMADREVFNSVRKKGSWFNRKTSHSIEWG